MICPFCHSKLKPYRAVFHTAYSCEAEKCLNDEMSRYEATYNNYPTYILSRVFMFDKHYIHVDYKAQRTEISKIDSCILMDVVVIPGVLHVNLKQPHDILKRIKMLMVFS